MHKEEIIQIHRILYLLADYLKSKNLIKDIKDYEMFNIRPFHVNKSKEDHLIAIFLLSREILQNILENDGMQNAEEVMITIHAINNILSKRTRSIKEYQKELKEGKEYQKILA